MSRSTQEHSRHLCLISTTVTSCDEMLTCDFTNCLLDDRIALGGPSRGRVRSAVYRPLLTTVYIHRRHRVVERVTSRRSVSAPKYVPKKSNGTHSFGIVDGGSHVDRGWFSGFRWFCVDFLGVRWFFVYFVLSFVVVTLKSTQTHSRTQKSTQNPENQYEIIWQLRKSTQTSFHNRPSYKQLCSLRSFYAERVSVRFS